MPHDAVGACRELCKRAQLKHSFEQGIARRSDSATLLINACHPERSEGSGSTDAEILRFAQDDSKVH